MDKISRLLISTLYKGNVVKLAVFKYSPNKLILLVDNPIDEVRANSIKEIKNKFSDLVQIEVKESPIYNVVATAKMVARIIDQEYKKNNEIILHISEARKTYAFGLLYGAYARPNKVSSIIYLTKEDNSIIELPILNNSIEGTKKKLLEEIEKGNNTARKLSKVLGIHLSMVYVHLKQLREKGMINEGMEVTGRGKLSII